MLLPCQNYLHFLSFSFFFNFLFPPLYKLNIPLSLFSSSLNVPSSSPLSSLLSDLISSSQLVRPIPDVAGEEPYPCPLRSLLQRLVSRISMAFLDRIFQLCLSLIGYLLFTSELGCFVAHTEILPRSRSWKSGFRLSTVALCTVVVA